MIGDGVNALGLMQAQVASPWDRHGCRARECSNHAARNDLLKFVETLKIARVPSDHYG